jgi:hypothetical protein
MEMKKPLVYFVAFATLFYLLSPVGLLRAQTCDPDALSAVKNPQKVLRFGARNSAVKNLQACLIEAGYNIPAGATGYYGAQTRKAVKEFYKEWYGAWHGNWVGPQGVKNLVAIVKGVQEQPTTVEQPTTPTTGVSPDVLAQVLQKIQAGDVQGALSLLLSALGGAQAPTTPVEQPTGPITVEQPTQPTAAEEGFLTVEQDPSVVAVTLREGETGKVFGLRMRADNGDVNVQSVFLRWATTSDAAPHRIISKIEIVDEQGNVLFSRNVDNTTFYQDSNLNYYLPVTGLNFRVPKNTYKSLFVQVTVLGTLPSNVNKAGFYVNANDVRGVDGVGVQRFAPASGIPTLTFTLQPAIAGQAEWVVARNVNTPKEGYLFGSVVDGKLYNQKVLSLNVTAKYDSLRMTSLSGVVSGNATVTAVYLRYGNQTLASSPVSSSGSFTFNVTPANFTVGKDQTFTLDVYADFANGTTSEATSSIKVTDISGQNSLGDTKSKSVSVASDVMHYLTVGPQFVFKTPTTQYTPPSQTASSSYQVVFEFDVTPVNGDIEMGTTTNVTTNFADVKLQKDSGSTSAPNGGVTVNVYQGSTDVTNSLTVSSNGLWVLSQGQTYTFKITAVQNGAPSGTTGLYRWIVDSIKWRNSAGSQTADWTERELVTGYTNVQ